MQEDSYYADYLQKKDSDTPAAAIAVKVERPLDELAANILAQVSTVPGPDQPKQQEMVVELLKDSEVNYLASRYSHSRSLSELHMFPNLWDELFKSWGNTSKFVEDIDELLNIGLVELPSGTPKDAKLTSIGEAVAKKLENENELWNQKQGRYMKDDEPSPS